MPDMFWDKNRIFLFFLHQLVIIPLTMSSKVDMKEATLLPVTDRIKFH